jgi:hypothetical protein
MDPVIGYTWNWICQREKMKLSPASGKRWNWILPAGKLGAGSSQ